MLGNTIGRFFRITTCGESYGKGLATIVDGVPPGLELSEPDIQVELDRRRPGTSPIDSPRLETDKVEIISGVMDGVTTGAPVGLVIYNVDTQQIHVDQYCAVKDLLRPGHAEYTFFIKYGDYADWRGAGRASGRESAGRVAGGAVAGKILKRDGIEVLGYVKESHGIKAREMSYKEVKKNYRKNEINCPDLEAGEKMIEDILKVKEEGDTVGGIVEVIAHGVPPGLGEPVFNKLEADMASALMGIAAVKGVEFGTGFEHVRMKGSEANDIPYIKDGRVHFRSNHAGGMLGGISNGDDIVVRIAVKPTATISKDQDTVNMATMKDEVLSAITRRDATICARIVAVAEAMMRIVILDHLFMHRGYQRVANIKNPWAWE